MGRSLLLIKGNEENHVVNAWRNVVGTLRQFEMNLSMARPTIRGRFDLLTEDGYKALLRNPVFTLVEEKKIEESDIRRDSSANDELLVKNPNAVHALVQVDVTGMLTFGSQSIFYNSFMATGNAGVRCDGIHISWDGLANEAVPREIEVESKNGKFTIINPVIADIYNQSNMFDPVKAADAAYKLKPRQGRPADEFYSYPDYYQTIAQGNRMREKIGEFRKRQALAEKTGRVTDLNPDYLGKWFEGNNPGALGHFELFIKSRNGKIVVGEIEDTLGTATFRGEIHGGHIKFVKQYIHSLDDSAYSGKMTYEGKNVDGKFRGTYSNESGTVRGDFEMHQLGTRLV